MVHPESSESPENGHNSAQCKVYMHYNAFIDVGIWASCPARESRVLEENQ
jgi:hypothetical protein